LRIYRYKGEQENTRLEVKFGKAWLIRPVVQSLGLAQKDSLLPLWYIFSGLISKRLGSVEAVFVAGFWWSFLAEIVIYEPSARKHFSRMRALFEARATKERVLHLRECASSRIEVSTIFIKEHYVWFVVYFFIIAASDCRIFSSSLFQIFFTFYLQILVFIVCSNIILSL
jgi:hypothetical protein